MLTQTRFGPLDLLIVDLAPRYRRPESPDANVHTDRRGDGHPRIREAPRSLFRHALDMNKEIGAPIIGAIENMTAFGCDNCRSVRPLFPQGETTRIVRRGRHSDRRAAAVRSAFRGVIRSGQDFRQRIFRDADRKAADRDGAPDRLPPDGPDPQSGGGSSSADRNPRPGSRSPKLSLAIKKSDSDSGRAVREGE